MELAMRIVFCGSDAFAVPTLRKLAEERHQIPLVFTQPDRPAGRGGRTHATSVKSAAEELGLAIAQPETLKGGEANALLAQAEADLAVIVAYGHLIPGDMLGIPAQGFINLHASILPKYRGAAPVPHAILEGEETTGVTVFQLNEKFDMGGILGKAEIAIEPEDTSHSLLTRLAPIGAELVSKVVQEMASGCASPEPQTHEHATRAPKLTKRMGQIEWHASAARIERMTRAFQPWPLAYTYAGTDKRSVRLVVLRAEVNDMPEVDGESGSVLVADGKRGLLVQCGEGALWLREVKPEGKRAMSGAEFVRGSRLHTGNRMR